MTSETSPATRALHATDAQQQAGGEAGSAGAAWVSLEGVNGVGKTHLARHAAARFGPGIRLLSELPDTPAGQLPGRVIAALRADGDPFLRTGHPGTETLLLAALQVHRYEATAGEPGQVVLEDRGPYSVAAYQAAVATTEAAETRRAAMADKADKADKADEDDEAEVPGRGVALAVRILDVIAAWRPLPRVLLLVDDPARCASRFERRIGRPATRSEHALMTRAAHLYEQLAAARPHDVTVFDRRELDADALVTAIVTTCRTAHQPPISTTGATGLALGSPTPGPPTPSSDAADRRRQP